MTLEMRALLPASVRGRTTLEDDPLVQTCKTIYTVAGALVLGFGAVYELAQPDAADPWTLRLIFAAVCVSLALATNLFPLMRRVSVQLTAALLYVLTAWFIFLAAFNGFSPEYGLGLLFTIAAAGFALLITQESLRPVAVYTASVLASVSILIVAIQPPRDNGWLTVGAVAGIGLVIIFASRLRIRLVFSLAASERRFRKLSDAAFEAVFVTESGRIVDCNANAVALLGHTSEDPLLGCALQDFMPRDAAPLPVPSGSMEAPSRSESLVVRNDGELVPVEIRIRSADDAGQKNLVVVVRDISDQKRFEEELIVSRRRVQESLDVRNTILTNVSHEFRTPLAVMLGYAEMLKDQAEAEAAELGALIYDSGRKLNDTLNLILELAQIEGGGFAIELEDADVAALVDEVIRTYRPRAEVKALELRLSVHGGEHQHALVDRVRVLKTIDYLLDNALKYTDRGLVEVFVTSDENWVYVAVSDTGAGIGEEFLSNLFTPFKQESAGLTRSHGGLGVGLAIARHMIECMGGSIDVASRKGEGSVFAVSLPRKPLPPSEQPELLPELLQRGTTSQSS